MIMILLVIVPLVLFAVILSIYFYYRARKWYKRGFNDILYEIDRYLSGERRNKPYVEKPHGPYLCYQNKWWWKGAYDAYDANFINLI